MNRLCCVWMYVAMVTNTIAIEQYNPKHLDVNADYVCTAIEQIEHSEKITVKQYFAVRTETWCFKLPPRCSNYYQGNRDVYKIQTMTKQVEHVKCCQGYTVNEGTTSCKPQCEYDCLSDKKQGVCISPGICECNLGFRGRYCESGCSDDRWGKDCSYVCTCGTHGSCDPNKGNCICHVGYTGENCTQTCVDSYGIDCIHQCACENGATCNNRNGECTCAPGFYGPYCRHECTYLTVKERGCEQTCPCQNNGKCDEKTGQCICSPGFKGEVCSESCSKNEWGPNCSNTCLCYYGNCDVKTGECVCLHGYAGNHCERECPRNTYGKSCLTQCRCDNNGTCYHDDISQEIRCDCLNTGYHGDACDIRDCPDGEHIVNVSTTGEPVCTSCLCDWNSTDSCHPLNGTCFCSTGYHGSKCSDKCQMPHYGYRCEEKCACAHGDCHHVTGNCSRCYAGYIGEYCNETCPNGTWGVGCAHQCECLNGAYCKFTTGYCECKSGFYGLRCGEHCRPDRFGPDCKYKCNCNTETSECSPYTGKCHCKPGYTGPNCEKTCTQGFFGAQCRQLCNCNSKTSRCDPINGHCECRGGWHGIKCMEQCPYYLWGPYCSEMCQCNGNGQCDPETGTCYCDAGYYGNTCEIESHEMSVFGMRKDEQIIREKKKTTSMLIPGILACIIIVILCVCFSRKHWCAKTKGRSSVSDDEDESIDSDGITDYNDNQGRSIEDGDGSGDDDDDDDNYDLAHRPPNPMLQHMSAPPIKLTSTVLLGIAKMRAHKARRDTNHEQISAGKEDSALIRPCGSESNKVPFGIPVNMPFDDSDEDTVSGPFRVPEDDQFVEPDIKHLISQSSELFEHESGGLSVVREPGSEVVEISDDGAVGDLVEELDRVLASDQVRTPRGKQGRVQDNHTKVHGSESIELSVREQVEMHESKSDRLSVGEPDSVQNNESVKVQQNEEDEVSIGELACVPVSESVKDAASSSQITQEQKEDVPIKILISRNKTVL